MDLQNQSPNQFFSSKKESASGHSTVLKILFGIFIFIALVISYFLFESQLFPYGQKGHYYDMAYIDGKIFIRTDDFIGVTLNYKSPGQRLVRYFNRRYFYVYDTVQQKIVQRMITYDNFDKAAPLDTMFSYKNQVWIINNNAPYEDVFLQIFDQNAKQSLNTSGFLQKFPELKAGLAEANLVKNPLHLDLTTKDGKKFQYYFEFDKVFLNYQDYIQYYQNNPLIEDNFFVLAGESSSDLRKELYKVSGSGLAIQNFVGADNFVQKNEINAALQDSGNALTFKKLTASDVYLESLIVYQDKDIAVILHQNPAGKEAKRFLTAVDVSGKVRWIVPPDELFSELAVTKSNKFSELFFVKEKIHTQRDQNMLIFQLDQVGIFAIDLTTGKKIWTFNAFGV